MMQCHLRMRVLALVLIGLETAVLFIGYLVVVLSRPICAARTIIETPHILRSLFVFPALS